MQLFVQTLTGRTIRIDVEPSTEVDDLKAKIFDHEGLPDCAPLSQLRLAFASVELSSGRVLSDYNIKPSSKLYIRPFALPKTVPKKVKRVGSVEEE